MEDQGEKDGKDVAAAVAAPVWLNQSTTRHHRTAAIGRKGYSARQHAYQLLPVRRRARV